MTLVYLSYVIILLNNKISIITAKKPQLSQSSNIEINYLRIVSNEIITLATPFYNSTFNMLGGTNNLMNHKGVMKITLVKNNYKENCNIYILILSF